MLVRVTLGKHIHTRSTARNDKGGIGWYVLREIIFSYPARADDCNLHNKHLDIIISGSIVFVNGIRGIKYKSVNITLDFRVGFWYNRANK